MVLECELVGTLPKFSMARTKTQILA
jgi:hypothetical protein